MSLLPYMLNLLMFYNNAAQLLYIAFTHSACIDHSQCSEYKTAVMCVADLGGGFALTGMEDQELIVSSEDDDSPHLKIKHFHCPLIE